MTKKSSKGVLRSTTIMFLFVELVSMWTDGCGTQKQNIEKLIIYTSMLFPLCCMLDLSLTCRLQRYIRYDTSNNFPVRKNSFQDSIAIRCKLRTPRALPQYDN